MLARQGSGSAARSIYGGFVEMHAGVLPDGEDAFADPIVGEEAADDWGVCMVVAVVDGGNPKDVLSRDGMIHTARTSPFYGEWLKLVPGHLEEARQAILHRDLERLGEITEQSSLAMHATAMAAYPGLIYFRGATLDVIYTVRTLRRQGAQAYCTVDAGPHVKVLCAASAAELVATTLRQIAGITDVLCLRPGRGVTVIQ